jgi:hypothetical protein
VPDAVVGKLNAQFREILSLESVRYALADAGAEIVSGSPEDAERIHRAESERFRRRMPR